MIWPHRKRPCRQPAWVTDLQQQLQVITNILENLMALVQVEQTDLDTLASNLEAAVTAVESEIAALKQALPAADLSGLNTALANLQALEVPAAAAS